LSHALHVDLDGAWTDNGIVADRLDVTDWGPKLRFSAPPRLIEAFFTTVQSRLCRFLLCGSGDFHHLSGLWIRKVTDPFVLVSFDNHPDWDIRPPKWGCGGWLNRALELATVQRATVWGCGNFECWWPGQLFGNRRAEREGKLEVHPWADDRSSTERKRRGAILQGNWHERFEEFVRSIEGSSVYVTIDMDCFRPNEAITNWENGRFTTDDVQWAIRKLRERSQIVGGDMCGAFTEPRYARRKQRFAAEFDHPKVSRPSPEEIRQINFRTLEKLWPVLVG
jgi:hypothetical protein